MERLRRRIFHGGGSDSDARLCPRETPNPFPAVTTTKLSLAATRERTLPLLSVYTAPRRLVSFISFFLVANLLSVRRVILSSSVHENQYCRAVIN